MQRYFKDNFVIRLKPYKMFKFKPLGGSRRTIETILDKVTSKFNAVYRLFKNIISYYRNFLNSADGKSNSETGVINANIKLLVLEQTANMRNIAWYLLQALNYDGSLLKAENLIASIRSTNMLHSDHLLEVAEAFYKKRLGKIKMVEVKKMLLLEVPISQLETFYSAKVIIGKSSMMDSKAPIEYYETFQSKQVHHMSEVLSEIKTFSKKLSEAYSKEPLLTIKLLTALQGWILLNFGAVDQEKNILILRMVGGCLDNTRPLMSLLILSHFNPLIEESYQFTMLFKQVLNVDIGQSEPSKRAI